VRCLSRTARAGAEATGGSNNARAFGFFNDPAMTTTTTRIRLERNTALRIARFLENGESQLKAKLGVNQTELNFERTFCERDGGFIGQENSQLALHHHNRAG